MNYRLLEERGLSSTLPFARLGINYNNSSVLETLDTILDKTRLGIVRQVINPTSFIDLKKK